MPFSFAGTKSNEGVIHFDANNDGNSEMSLCKTGLSLLGNLTLDQLGLGPSSSGDNLSVRGTIGMTVEWVNSNTTLSGNSVVFADSSANFLYLTLPYAGNVEGRMVLIKKTSGLNAVFVAGNIERDYLNLSIGASANREKLPFVSLFSSDNVWWIQASRNVTLTEPFTAPTSISGLQLWLDASDNSTISKGVSDNVYQWSDKSGHNYHATQVVSARQPLYRATDSRAGNQPSIGGNVNSGFIGVVTPSISVGRIYCVVAYKDGADATFDDYSTLFSGPGANGALRVMGNIGTNSLFSSSTFASQSYVNGSRTISSAILSMPLSLQRFEGSASQVWSIGFNSQVSARAWNGPICEVIFTDGAETDYEIQVLEGYLAWKWGLQGDLDASHIFKNAAP